ncbi:hypothetical protein KV112_20645 [Mycolicibacter sp. MYC123]|uniref:Secretion protein EspK n=1 Tax=[Mycobacterium] zoologicum TaxID=2872311 RepID=A0ABU5YPX5_9MYCO|nr:hypothetical protein [Mycolicibacter sp. MYC123]MEB3052122.1 hypothetical protein [Mycolicibacter sp. MYC123]
MSAGDIPQHADQPGWAEVVGDSWPPDSETTAHEASQAQLRNAERMGEASRTAGQGRDYATSEMSGEAAEGIAQDFARHAVEMDDCQQNHLYTAGWLLEWAGAIVAAKTAMNAAADAHLADHVAPTATGLTRLDPSARTQAQKDASLQAAQAAVQDARHALESAKAMVALGISSNQKPMLVPKLPTSSVGDGTKIGDRPDAVPDPTAGGGLTSPIGGGSPGLTSPGPSSPGLSNPTLPPTLPAGAGGPSAGTGGPATPAAPPAISAPTLPTEAGAGAAGGPAASLPGDAAGSSPMSGMGGMPMGGMPMGGGGMPMQPPQMPQMPTQTPGADIAKTAGDTLSKLAGGPGGGAQSLDSATLDKLLDANSSSNDDDSGKLSDGAGVVPAGDKGATAGVSGPNGLGHNGAGSTLTNPYSAANANPSLNNPTPLVGPPSPAAATVTPTPPVVSAPVTELSGDEAAPPASTSASAAHPTTSISGDPASSAHSGGSNAAGDRQQSVMGGYPATGGLVPPMAAGGAVPPPPAAAGPVIAAGGAAAAAPMLLPTSTTTTTKIDSAASALFADPAGSASSERLAVLPPEQAVAHEHLAGVLRAFRDRPGMAWTTVQVAIGVFIYEEPGLPTPRIRYILATTDGLSLIPMNVQVPAGIELLGGLIDPAASFVADWSGHERPALKLVAAADAYPDLLGDLDYLVSSDSGTEDGIKTPARAGDVVEVVQSKTQTEALIATHKASRATRPRTTVEWPRIAPGQAAAALEALGMAFGFNDGSPTDTQKAAGMLWGVRWGRRLLERPDNYLAVLATFWYEEGMEALELGRLDEAAYAASALAEIRL